MKFQFSNVVIVDGDNIGVIVKSWEGGTHEVYVRYHNGVRTYNERDIKHYVYGKELLDDQYEFYPQTQGN